MKKALPGHEKSIGWKAQVNTAARERPKKKTIA
jgi:hypothetical protein